MPERSNPDLSSFSCSLMISYLSIKAQVIFPAANPCAHALRSFFIIYLLCMYACLNLCLPCPCGSWEFSSGCQTWGQAPLPAESSWLVRCVPTLIG